MDPSYVPRAGARCYWIRDVSDRLHQRYGTSNITGLTSHQHLKLHLSHFSGSEWRYQPARGGRHPTGTGGTGPGGRYLLHRALPLHVARL